MTSQLHFGEGFSGTQLFGGKGVGLTTSNLCGFRKDLNDSGIKINFPWCRTKIVSQDVAMGTPWLHEQTKPLLSTSQIPPALSSAVTSGAKAAVLCH